MQNAVSVVLSDSVVFCFAQSEWKMSALVLYSVNGRLLNRDCEIHNGAVDLCPGSGFAAHSTTRRKFARRQVVCSTLEESPSEKHRYQLTVDSFRNQSLCTVIQTSHRSLESVCLWIVIPLWS